MKSSAARLGRWASNLSPFCFHHRARACVLFFGWAFNSMAKSSYSINASFDIDFTIVDMAPNRPWTLAILVPIIAVFFGLLIEDWFSENFGPALHEEASRLWIASVFLFPAVSLASLDAGWRIRRHAA